MATYATVDNLRAEPDVGNDDPPTDAELEALLVKAERRVDRLAGAWGVGPDGRKYPVADLEPLYAGAVRDATVILAAALHRNPNAFDPPAAADVEGPDFKLTGARMSPAGVAAITEAVGILDTLGLRRLSARAR